MVRKGELLNSLDIVHTDTVTRTTLMIFRGGRSMAFVLSNIKQPNFIGVASLLQMEN